MILRTRIAAKWYYQHWNHFNYVIYNWSCIIMYQKKGIGNTCCVLQNRKSEYHVYVSLYHISAIPHNVHVYTTAYATSASYHRITSSVLTWLSFQCPFLPYRNMSVSHARTEMAAIWYYQYWYHFKHIIYKWSCMRLSVIMY